MLDLAVDFYILLSNLHNTDLFSGFRIKEATKTSRNMHPTMLIILFAAAVALACPPPFNNPAFRGNATHTSAELIAAVLNPGGGLAWNEVVSPELNNPVKPWPKDNKTVVFTHTINYCFDDSEAQEKLSSLVTDTIALWMYK
jgi:hypothetical protein